MIIHVLVCGYLCARRHVHFSCIQALGEKMFGVKIGFGNGYVAEVGASMVYARAVELGLPEWKSGVKYPYLAPAAESLKQSGKLNRTFTGAFVQYLRG